MAGQDAGELGVADRLVDPRDGEVPSAPVSPRQRRVRDLADERLDESILAALRRARVGLELEELAADEIAQTELDLRLGLGSTAHRSQDRGHERLAEDRGVLDEHAVGRLEGVEP